MGNSKQARFSSGGSSMNPTAAMHIHMTSAPPSTVGRSFNSGGSGSLSQTMGNVVRRRLTRIELMRYSASKGTTNPTKKTPAEEAAPEYNPQYVCLKAVTPTWSGADSFFDQAPMTPDAYKYWVPTKGAYGDLHVDLSNIYVVPDPSYAKVYTHDDNPFAMRATFDPLGHAKIHVPFSAPIFRTTVAGFTQVERDVPAFVQTSKLILATGDPIAFTIVPDPRASATVAPEYVDMSFDYSSLSSAEAKEFRNNASPFTVMTVIEQKNLKNKAELTVKSAPPDDLNRRTVYAHSANRANGLFVFKPPKAIIASELYNGLHATGGADISNVSPVAGVGSGAIHGLANNILNTLPANTGKGTNGVKLYLDSPLPNNGFKMNGPKKEYDWFSIQFRQAGSADQYTDVSNLTIEQSSATSGFNRIGFDICNHDITDIVELHATVKLPSSVKILAGAAATDVSFTADLTNNMLLQKNSPLVKTVNMRLYHGGIGKYSRLWPFS